MPSRRSVLCQLALAGLAMPLAPTLLHGAGTPIVPRHRVVKQLRITILSTMLADEGLGEWGFAALVEVDGHRLLFDTGAHEDVVARNAREVDITLDTVPEVVLSHFHGDHTSGLVALRREVAARQRTALARAHVADGIFAPRLRDGEARDYNDMNRVRPQYEAADGSFTVHGKPTEIHPGVWLTGPVPRRHPERNWSVGARPARVQLGAQLVEDTVPDDMAMIIDTDQGLVVLTGCGHAGVVNIIAHARDAVRPAPVHALIGAHSPVQHARQYRALSQRSRWRSSNGGRAGASTPGCARRTLHKAGAPAGRSLNRSDA